jgi:hypothetical protein
MIDFLLDLREERKENFTSSWLAKVSFLSLLVRTSLGTEFRAHISHFPLFFAGEVFPSAVFAYSSSYLHLTFPHHSASEY